MIFKKPYAFLIKHFKLIHLLLLIPITYLISKTTPIISFFRSYVASGYTTNLTNIAGSYINWFMYLAVIFILLSLIVIYLLMKSKAKKTNLYFFMIIYYLALFVLISVSYNILNNIERGLISVQVARACRDISFVLLLPQYLFLIITFFRGIGFDIRKFNFSKDLEDLEIRDTDSEEVEVNINLPAYKVKRKARRLYREFKYYILENKFIFFCLIAIFVIFIGTTIYMNFNVYNKNYYSQDKMNHNGLSIEIEDSILTNMAYNGNIINDGKYYLVLQLYIENKSKSDKELDYTNFRLVLNDKNIYPTLDIGDYFIDYGKPYKKEEIKSGTSNYYVLAYEIDESELVSQYTIKVLESINYSVGDIVTQYKNIVLKPKKINEIEVVETINTDQTLNLKESNLGYTTFKVNSIMFDNSYTYSYQKCTNNNCQTLKDKVTTSLGSTIEKTILFILDADFNLDETTIYASNIKNNNAFFEHFMTLQYVINGKTSIAKVSNKTNSNMNRYVFEVHNDVSEADSINLLITNRNKRYVIKLR